jgi:hypothetical protein
MKCSICAQITPDSWEVVGYVRGSGKDFTSLGIDWMRCANDECLQAAVRITESHSRVVKGQMVNEETAWFARPRGVTRLLDPLVPDPFRTDYVEAASILDLSPRMSAVLSRRILGDLLEKYAGQTQFSLASRIDKFIADPAQPGYIKENLHHFREIADFGAHTQKDEQQEIIDVNRDEAEWTLDILDSLFDHFIVAPERNRAIREAMDKKIKAAGRKQIEPVPPGS